MVAIFILIVVMVSEECTYPNVHFKYLQLTVFNDTSIMLLKKLTLYTIIGETSYVNFTIAKLTLKIQKLQTW